MSQTQKAIDAAITETLQALDFVRMRKALNFNGNVAMKRRFVELMVKEIPMSGRLYGTKYENA
jgi:hypothetical protein